MDKKLNKIVTGILKNENALRACTEQKCKAEHEIARHDAMPKAMAIAMKKGISDEQKKKLLKDFALKQIKTKKNIELQKCHIAKCEVAIRQYIAGFITIASKSKNPVFVNIVTIGNAMLSKKTIISADYQKFISAIVQSRL